MADTTYRVRRSEDGQYYVVQVAGNGEALNTSETHPDKRDAINGAIASGALPSQIRDETE